MNIISIILGWIGLLILAVVLCSLPVFILWNWLMPYLFGLPEITIWQSFGIMLLSQLLFWRLDVKQE